jgi:hypothetical protein
MGREDEIRLIAYSIWEEESCPNGRDCEHWFRAELIWEQKQKQKAVAKRTETRLKQAAKQGSKVMTPKKTSKRL